MSKPTTDLTDTRGQYEVVIYDGTIELIDAADGRTLSFETTNTPHDDVVASYVEAGYVVTRDSRLPYDGNGPE